LAKRTLSALKSVRQANARRVKNRQKKLKLRKMLKEIKGLKEKAAILESLPKVQALVDKSVKRGLVHKNTAARIKSKLMKLSKKTDTTNK